MHKLKTALLLFCLFVFAAGCGDGTESSQEDTTSIEIKKNGSIVQHIVEDFSAEYYNLDELEQTMQDEIASFESTSENGKVELEKVQEKDGKVYVDVQYEDAECYTAFNQMTVFAGTVSDAYNAGYSLDVTLYSNTDGDGASIGKEELLEMGDRHLVIVEEAVKVKTPGDILYFTNDVSPSERADKVTVSGDENLSYIVYE